MGSWRTINQFNHGARGSVRLNTHADIHPHLFGGAGDRLNVLDRLNESVWEAFDPGGDHKVVPSRS